MTDKHETGKLPLVISSEQRHDDVTVDDQQGARTFVNGDAVLTSYALVFALIWGPTRILGAVVGTTDFLRTQAELTSAADVDP